MQLSSLIHYPPSIVCIALVCRLVVCRILHCFAMQSKPLAKQFGVVVRRLRQELGISQEEFARLCHVHRTYMGSIERGEKTVTIETANKIARALGLSLSQLFVQLEAEQQVEPQVQNGLEG